MNNKKGFTLMELLAVIVILGIIMFIVARSVIESVNQSKFKVRFLAAKEIAEIADAYIATEITDGNKCVTIEELYKNGFLADDAIDPSDENAKIKIKESTSLNKQKICLSNETTLQEDMEPVNELSSPADDEIHEGYSFDGLIYIFK